jgi:hypothetical protein
MANPGMADPNPFHGRDRLRRSSANSQNINFVKCPIPSPSQGEDCAGLLAPTISLYYWTVPFLENSFTDMIPSFNGKF